MALDHIIKHSCRFNIKNPQHRKVNEVLIHLDPEVCKSNDILKIAKLKHLCYNINCHIIKRGKKNEHKL